MERQLLNHSIRTRPSKSILIKQLSAKHNGQLHGSLRCVSSNLHETKSRQFFSSFQILNSQDGNVNIINFVADDSAADEKNVYRSHLEFQSITTEYVGKYYCVFNNSIKNESEKNFDEEVEKFKASSIYIFVNGERRIEAKCQGFN